MLSVVMLKVVMLSVVVLSAVMLIVVMLSVVMLSVVAPHQMLRYSRDAYQSMLETNTLAYSNIRDLA